MLAEATAVATTSGPTWEMIAIGCVTIIMSLIGAYATGVGRRVSALEHYTTELKVFILREYQDKITADRMREELKRSLDALHARLDRAGFPHNQGT